MLGNLFARRSSGTAGLGSDWGASRILLAVLAALPPEWQVLRNRLIRAADGPPWVKFIALHAEKGIALIDLLPADPTAAIEPLDEFLARTGLGAFSRGDPPIVAVALGEDDIAALGYHLDEAFAAAAPCGIKNPDWPEAVAELLISTPGLFLARLAKPADAPAASKNLSTTDRETAAVEPRVAGLPALAASDAVEVAIAGPTELVRSVAAATPLAPTPCPDIAANDRDGESPIEARSELAAVRSAGVAATILAASLVLGAIGLVYADWPKPAPPALAEAVVAPSPATEEPVPSADLTTRDATDARTVIAPAPQRKPAHYMTRAPRPVWEETRRAHRDTAKARPSFNAGRKQMQADNFFAAVNNWLLSIPSATR